MNEKISFHNHIFQTKQMLQDNNHSLQSNMNINIREKVHYQRRCYLLINNIIIQLFIIFSLVQICKGDITMMSSLSHQALSEIKFNQYLSTYRYHQIYHQKTKFQCITMNPFIQKSKINKIPKAIQMDYNQAKKYIDPLIGLCVLHETKQFIYQYCHGGQARQFDSVYTKNMNAKSQFQNIVLGKVRNTTQNIEKQKQMSILEKNQNNKKPNTQINSIYISPQPKFTKIDIRQSQQYKFIRQIGLIRSNNQIVEFDSRFISAYTIKCNGQKFSDHHFQIQGISISSHDIVLTNKIIASFIPNVTKQNLSKKNCTYITLVKLTRKTNISQWQRQKTKISLQQKQYNSTFAKKSNINNDKQNYRNQNKMQQIKQSLNKKGLNLQNINLMTDQDYEQLVKTLKQQLGMLNKNQEKHIALAFDSRVRSLQDFIYGQISSLCVPQHVVFEAVQPFQSSFFFFLPNATLSLKIYKNNPLINQTSKKEYYKLLVWVQQVVSKNVLRIKPAISDVQINKSQIKNILKILKEGAQIAQCKILSTEKLQSQQVHIKSAGWSNLIQVKNNQVKVGDVLRCRQPLNQFMFNLTIGNIFLPKTSFFESYSWAGEILEQYSKTIFKCHHYQNISTKSNNNYQKQFEQQIKIVKNNQLITHQVHLMSSKYNQKRQFNTLLFDYKIQFQPESMFSIQVKNQNGQIIDKYFISERKIYYLKKVCNFSQISRSQCKQIQIIYQNSYFQNRTVDNIIYFPTIYLKSVWILQKGEYILKTGIWRKGDYQPLARMFLNYPSGTIIINQGLIYVRQMSTARRNKPSLAKTTQSIQNMQKSYYDGVSPIQTSYTLIQGQFCHGNINKHRSTVIKFKCGQPILFLEKVKETESCVYLFNVVSNRFCGQNIQLNKKSSSQLKRETICYEDGMAMMYF